MIPVLADYTLKVKVNIWIKMNIIKICKNTKCKIEFFFYFTGIYCPGAVFSLQKGRTKVQQMVKRHMWSQC